MKPSYEDELNRFLDDRQLDCPCPLKPFQPER